MINAVYPDLSVLVRYATMPSSSSIERFVRRARPRVDNFFRYKYVTVAGHTNTPRHTLSVAIEALGGVPVLSAPCAMVVIVADRPSRRKLMNAMWEDAYLMTYKTFVEKLVLESNLVPLLSLEIYCVDKGSPLWSLFKCYINRVPHR